MSVKKGDLRNEGDIKLMVDTFYDKVNRDESLSYVFNDFAKVDWESHLPRMYAFWSNVLFATGTYRGNPFQKHIPLPVDKTHFDQWIKLFIENMDEHFEGEIAERAKLRAESIAHIFQTKLSHIKSTIQK